MPGVITQRKQQELSDRDRRFCREYITDFNGSRACVAIGYSKNGVDKTVARLLSRPAIQREIRRLVNIQLAKADLKLEHVIQELRYMFFRDVKDMFKTNDKGWLVAENLDELPYEVRACIDGIKVRNRIDDAGNVVGQDLEIKLVSKQAVGDMLMKYFGAYAPEKHEHKVVEEWDSSYPPPNVPSNIVLEIPKGDYSVGELYDGQVGEKHDGAVQGS